MAGGVRRRALHPFPALLGIVHVGKTGHSPFCLENWVQRGLASACPTVVRRRAGPFIGAFLVELERKGFCRR